MPSLYLPLSWLSVLVIPHKGTKFLQLKHTLIALGAAGLVEKGGAVPHANAVEVDPPAQLAPPLIAPIPVVGPIAVARRALVLAYRPYQLAIEGENLDADLGGLPRMRSVEVDIGAVGEGVGVVQQVAYPRCLLLYHLKGNAGLCPIVVGIPGFQGKGVAPRG